MRFRRSSIPAALCLVLASCSGGSEADLIARARAIHDRVITLDTHDDINPRNFTADTNYTQRLTTQVNLPKMEEGGLDVSFMIVYVGQDTNLNAQGYQRAYESAMEKFRAVHWLTDTLASNRIGLAYTSDDVRRIAASGRRVAMIGVENGYPIGQDITRVKQFHDLGARYMSLAHNGHSHLSDSNTGERDSVWMWNGLSPFGKQVIEEMNRVGIMIDISHPSKESMMQTLALTRAPIIASHSAIRALCNHSRNLDDEQLQALKTNGGVVQVVAFNSYVKTPVEPSAERTAAIASLREEFGLPAQGAGRRGGGAAGRGGGGGGGRGGLNALPPERREAFQQRMADIDQRLPPPPRATVSDFVDHIDYAVKLIGVDHVGISSDFDGGGGVDGWNDASETFNVTLELVRRGYSEEDIAKIWSGNLLRVLDEVQRVAVEMGKASN